MLIVCARNKPAIPSVPGSPRIASAKIRYAEYAPIEPKNVTPQRNRRTANEHARAMAMQTKSS